jgi:hypothetical protein
MLGGLASGALRLFDRINHAAFHRIELVFVIPSWLSPAGDCYSRSWRLTSARTSPMRSGFSRIGP